MNAMRTSLVLLVLLALGACTQNIHDMRLAEVDFSDRKSVSELGSQLAEPDRTAFLTYAAIHVPGTIGFCGQKLIGQGGEEPVTVGDAIRLTIARERTFRGSSRLEQAPKSDVELAAEQWDLLIDQRELLLHRQSMLLAEHGGAARNLPEWREIQGDLARLDADLKSARQKLDAARP